MSFIKITSVENDKILFLNLVNVRLIKEGIYQNKVCTEFVFEDGRSVFAKESVDSIMKGGNK